MKYRTQRLIAKFKEKTQKFVCLSFLLNTWYSNDTYNDKSNYQIHYLNRLTEVGWGWNDKTYENVYHRLNRTVPCFKNMTLVYTDIFTALKSPANDERLTAEILSVSYVLSVSLLWTSYKMSIKILINPIKFSSIHKIWCNCPVEIN